MDLRPLRKFAAVELRLFLREPSAVFFTLAFPIVLLVLFAAVFGNLPDPAVGGRGRVDVAIPTLMAVVVATTGLLTTTIHVSVYRERGIFRRLRATPVRPHVVMVAIMAVMLAATLLGALLLVTTGDVLYGVTIQGDALAMLVGLLLSSLSFFAVGFFLAVLAPSARSGQALANLLFFPMVFLSGAALPSEILPDSVRTVGNFLPLTYVVDLLRGLWEGDALGARWGDIGLLLAIGTASALVSARAFRWRPG